MDLLFYFTFLHVEQETSMNFIQNAPFCSLLTLLWPKSWRTDLSFNKIRRMMTQPLTANSFQNQRFPFLAVRRLKKKKKRRTSERRDRRMVWAVILCGPSLKVKSLVFFSLFPFVSPCTCQKSCSATSVNRSCHCHLFFWERLLKVTLQEVKISAAAGNIEPVCFLPIFQMLHRWQLPNRHRWLSPIDAIVELSYVRKLCIKW